MYKLHKKTNKKTVSLDRKLGTHDCSTPIETGHFYTKVYTCNYMYFDALKLNQSVWSLDTFSFLLPSKHFLLSFYVLCIPHPACYWTTAVVKECLVHCL